MYIMSKSPGVGAPAGNINNIYSPRVGGHLQVTYRYIMCIVPGVGTSPGKIYTCNMYSPRREGISRKHI